MSYFKPDKSGPWNPSSREIDESDDDIYVIMKCCFMTRYLSTEGIYDSCFLANSYIDQLIARVQEEDES